MTQFTTDKTSIVSEGAVPSNGTGNPGPRTEDSRRTVRLAPFETDHREQVFRLYQEVFGPVWADSFRARWQWAQEQSLYPGDSPKWVLLDGERVIGFLATIPLPYVAEGTTLLAHTPCDYMVHPDYRFHGIKLMREFFRTCENCVTCDDIPSTIKVTTWLGGEPVGMLVRHVKLLDSRALVPKRAWAGAAPLRWPINTLLRWADKVRSWRRRNAFEVEAAYNFDQRFEAFFQKLTPLVPMMAAKDRRFLDWRYGRESPQASREIGVVTNQKNELLGYIIFYLSTRVGNNGCILDLQVLPPQGEEVAASLLGYAIERLRAKGAWSIRYYHFASPSTLPGRILKQFGFIPRGGHHFLVRFQDPDIARIAKVQDSWNYNYGDSEASHAST